MAKLVLFDIDGTLIESVKSCHEAFKAALKEIYNVDVLLEEIYELEGLTDNLAYFTILRKKGFSEKEINEKLEKADDFLIRFIEKNLKKEDAKVLPGIYNLLELLKDKAELGLITGNLENIAWIKIRLFNLKKYFKTGGFGSDALERKDVVRAAIKKSENYFNKKFDKIIVIGDTIHDIKAANPLAIAIGVATGVQYSFDELKKANADYVFKSFKDYKKAAEVILNDKRLLQNTGC